MKAGITILVENSTPAPSLIGEYGFAALLTVDDRKILFDTGSADALFHNSEVLGIKLEEIEALVISHGHFDHTTAIIPLLEKYGQKKMFAHSNVFARRFSLRSNGQIADISCPFNRQQLMEAGAEITYTDDFKEIFPDIYVSGQIPRNTGFEDVGGNFKIKAGDELLDDEIIDDMALIVNHPDGLIILSGCAHSGMINTIEYALQKTGRSKVKAFVGGTHLINASSSRLEKTVAALRILEVEKLMIGHCTGFYAAARLYHELGSRVIKADSGMSFHF